MSSMTQAVQSLTTVQETSPTVYCALPLPDHTQLPDKDGSFVKNYQEPPQADLLTDTITPILE
ncbi:MAG: Uma2 family endonuclease, partial [Microcystis sp.]